MSDAISISSPNGRVSARSKDAARERLSESLFGKGGLAKPTAVQPTEVERLRRNAKQLRELAARGMKPRAYAKEAAKLEAQADSLEKGSTTNSTPWRYVTANFRSGKTRTETLNGKEYIVAPMTLIVPGVLNGSQGALYYPASEIAKNYKAWDGIPITVYHPHKGGTPVSAKDKGVMNRQGVGFLKNPQVRNGRLIAEGWFDSERTKRVDSRVHEALSKNEKMELSTGLYTNNIPAQNGAKDPKGRAYTHTATDHVPDHLAVLPDQKGACSLNDGCGMLVNSNDSLSENAMAVSRPKLIKFITANCDCYKGKEKVLENEEAFSDDDLKKLKTAVENSKKNELIVNAAKEGFKDGENEYKFDETEGSFIATKVENAKAKPEEDEEDDEEEMPMMVKKGGKAGKYPMNRKKQTDNERKEPKVQTEEEWFKAAPAGVRNMFLKQKRAMVDKIVANVSDEDEKEAKVKRLMAKNTEQLEEMLEFIPERPAREEEERFSVFGGDYSGASVAPIGNREVVDDDEILDVPTINWAEEKANENKRRMQTA